jgi:hypothetical protein
MENPMRLVHQVVVLSLALTLASSTAWPRCNQNCPERRTISVNGTGTVTADAELAIVRVGYKLYGPDAKTVYATATETSNAIMQALIAAGFEKSAIESTSQVLQHSQPFEWDSYPLDSPERKGRQFTATQGWVIRVKPDEAAKALDTAINAGANESGWIQWIVNEPTALEAQASAKAMANAHIIAEQTAQKAGVPLGHLVSTSENQGMSAYNGPIAGMAGMGSGMAGGIGAFAMVTVNNQPLAINSRRVVFSVSVYAVFAIE